MRITKIDANNAKQLQQQMVDALRKAAAELGVEVRAAGGALKGESLVLNFSFAPSDETEVERSERALFGAYCARYGLRPEHYGTVFVSRGSHYRVVGIQPQRPKFGILCKRVSDGGPLLFSRGAAHLIDSAYNAAKHGKVREAPSFKEIPIEGGEFA